MKILQGIIDRKSFDQPATSLFFQTVCFALLPFILILSAMAIVPIALLITMILLLTMPRSYWQNIWLQMQTKPIFGAVLLVSAYPLLTSFWSLDPFRSYSSAIGFIGFIFVFTALSSHYASKPLYELPNLTRVVPLIFSLIAAFLWMEIILDKGILSWLADAIHVRNYMHKAINRGLCAYAVFLPAAICCLRLQYGKIISIFAWTLWGAPLYFLDSNSAFLAFIIGGIVMAFFFIFGWRTTRFLVLLGLIMAFLLPWELSIIFALSPSATPLPESFLAKIPPSMEHRIYIWDFVLKYIWHQPWFGIGVNAAHAVPGAASRLANFGGAHLPMHPHNAALQLLLEVGFFGYALLAILAAFIWRYSGERNSSLRNCAQLATISSFCVIAISTFNIWISWWVCVALIQPVWCSLLPNKNE
jgi:O-antigen ligase